MSAYRTFNTLFSLTSLGALLHQEQCPKPKTGSEETSGGLSFRFAKNTHCLMKL
ncbi:unnamed protein product, partial [Ascophyllum nodosum]